MIGIVSFLRFSEDDLEEDFDFTRSRRRPRLGEGLRDSPEDMPTS